MSKKTRIIFSLFSITFIKRFLGVFIEFLEENVLSVKKINGFKKRISTSARFLYAENIYIGNKTNINRNSFIWASPNAKIKIGDNCLLGPNVTILTSKFNIKHKGAYKDLPSIEKDVIIEDNVWIGANTIILPGVVVGKNSIVAAGTVVTKSVPENSIAKDQKELIIDNRNYDR